MREAINTPPVLVATWSKSADNFNDWILWRSHALREMKSHFCSFLFTTVVVNQGMKECRNVGL